MAKDERAGRGAQKRQKAVGVATTPPGRPTRSREQPYPARNQSRRSSRAYEDRHVDTDGYLGSSAPPTPAPTWRRRLFIERPRELADAARQLGQAHVIALDAEFSQARVRGPDDPSHRLALLQMAADDEYDTAYVIDAQRLADLSSLEPVFADPAILKLFHAIGADARVLATRGLVARNTLDLEAVSRSIFGQRESGLQAMLQRACGVRLDKSLQRADWSKRPLTPAMIAYAARDAEMAFALYGWLSLHYTWAVALHSTNADETPPSVASWVAPYLEGARPRPAALAVAEVGLADDVVAQEEALRTALVEVRHPTQRARVMRLITDLELTRLAPNLRPYLAAPASEERAGAARGLGRLHSKTAIELIRPLLDDDVRDVRQAARLALETLTGATPPLRRHPPRTGTGGVGGQSGTVKWTSDPASAGQPDDNGWQAQLRARFGLPQEDAQTAEGAAGSDDEDVSGSEH
jgi:hypothetical protein